MMQTLFRSTICLAIAASAAMAQEQDSTAQIVAALRQGNPAEAERLCGQALASTPDNPRIWTLKGVADDDLHKPSDALHAYYQALSKAPGYLPALEGAARAEFRNGSQLAVPLLERAAKLRPGDLTIPVMLGELAFLRDDCAGAVEYFERGRDMLEALPRASERYGACLVRTDRKSQAVPIFEKLLQRHPESDLARYNLAFVQSAAGQYPEAVKTLAPLVDRTPPDSDSLSLAAEAYESMLDTPRAFEILKRALAYYPDNPEIYIAFAKLSLTHRSFQAGVDILNSGIGRLSEDASLHLARGILFLELGDWKRSEEDLNRAEWLDPKLPFSSAALGFAKLQLHDPAEARRLARSALKTQPDDPYLNYVFAESARQEGMAPGTPQFEETLACAQKAARLQPDFSRAHELLSRLYLDSGKIDQALAESREAVQKSPLDETALYQLILVTRRAGDSAELPLLLKRFEDLREASSRKEAQLRRYALLQRSSQGGGRQ